MEPTRLRGKLVLAVLPLAALLAGCPVPQSQDTPVPGHLKTEHTTGRDYWLYVPSAYSDQRYWPLVVTLHGTEPWDGPTRQMMEWKALAEDRGFIVMAPRLRSSQGILPRDRPLWYEDLAADEKLILAAIDEVSKQYRVDGRYVMLTGFSSGGLSMYDTGLRNPRRFSMLVARACNSDLEMLDRIPITDDVRQLPIVMFWGKSDLQPIQDQCWQAFEFMRKHKYNVTRRPLLQGGHLRRPELAYDCWKPLLPDEYVVKN